MGAEKSSRVRPPEGEAERAALEGATAAASDARAGSTAAAAKETAVEELEQTAAVAIAAAPFAALSPGDGAAGTTVPSEPATLDASAARPSTISRATLRPPSPTRRCETKETLAEHFEVVVVAVRAPAIAPALTAAPSPGDATAVFDVSTRCLAATLPCAPAASEPDAALLAAGAKPTAALRSAGEPTTCAPTADDVAAAVESVHIAAALSAAPSLAATAAIAASTSAVAESTASNSAACTAAAAQTTGKRGVHADLSEPPTCAADTSAGASQLPAQLAASSLLLNLRPAHRGRSATSHQLSHAEQPSDAAPVSELAATGEPLTLAAKPKRAVKLEHASEQERRFIGISTIQAGFKRFRAYAWRGGKTINLGHHMTAEVALRARDAWVAQYPERKLKLNFPPNTNTLAPLPQDAASPSAAAVSLCADASAPTVVCMSAAAAALAAPSLATVAVASAFAVADAAVSSSAVCAAAAAQTAGERGVHADSSELQSLLAAGAAQPAASFARRQVSRCRASERACGEPPTLTAKPKRAVKLERASKQEMRFIDVSTCQAGYKLFRAFASRGGKTIMLGSHITVEAAACERDAWAAQHPELELNIPPAGILAPSSEDAASPSAAAAPLSADTSAPTVVFVKPKRAIKQERRYIGVSTIQAGTKRFMAFAIRGGKNIYLGYHMTAEAAARARDAWAAQYPERKLNFFPDANALAPSPEDAASPSAAAAPLSADASAPTVVCVLAAAAADATFAKPKRASEQERRFIGVSTCKAGIKRFFRAYAWRGGKTINLGSHMTAEAAARARDAWITEYPERKLKLNFPPDANALTPSPEDAASPSAAAAPLSADASAPTVVCESAAAAADATFAKPERAVKLERASKQERRFIGVSTIQAGTKRFFKAYAWCGSKNINLGSHVTAEAAARARDAWAAQHPQRKLNFPPDASPAFAASPASPRKRRASDENVSFDGGKACTPSSPVVAFCTLAAHSAPTTNGTVPLSKRLRAECQPGAAASEPAADAARACASRYDSGTAAGGALSAACMKDGVQRLNLPATRREFTHPKSVLGLVHRWKETAEAALLADIAADKAIYWRERDGSVCLLDPADSTLFMTTCDVYARTLRPTEGWSQSLTCDGFDICEQCLAVTMGSSGAQATRALIFHDGVAAGETSKLTVEWSDSLDTALLNAVANEGLDWDFVGAYLNAPASSCAARFYALAEQRGTCPWSSSLALLPTPWTGWPGRYMGVSFGTAEKAGTSHLPALPTPTSGELKDILALGWENAAEDQAFFSLVICEGTRSPQWEAIMRTANCCRRATTTIAAVAKWGAAKPNLEAVPRVTRRGADEYTPKCKARPRSHNQGAAKTKSKSKAPPRALEQRHM
ncbi:hypothetical protein T492DRAFT_838862 [Pavlovales sp. CCMP2436]|nr:hypothetical protein T492DRAFT_838862 [Pavlovales sp. CCMP2436]